MSADMSPYCSVHDEWLIMKLYMYVGYHTANNVSNSAEKVTRNMNVHNYCWTNFKNDLLAMVSVIN